MHALLQFLLARQRGRGGAASGGSPPLARPAAPTFEAEPGVNDGEIEITVTAEPASWGDLTDPGDGLGVEGILQWWNAHDGWQELCDPSDTGLFIVTAGPTVWGTTGTIQVRGVSDGGRTGTAASDTVAVPGTTMALDDLTVSGDPATVSGDPATVYIPA